MLLLLLSHFSTVRLCATPEMAAHQAPPSLGLSRQEHWSGLPFPSPMHESEREVAQSCPTLSDPMDCSLPGSSIHGFSRQEYWSGVPLPFPRPFGYNLNQIAYGHTVEVTNRFKGLDLVDTVPEELWTEATHKVPRHPGLPREGHRSFPATLPLSLFYPPDLDRRVDSPALSGRGSRPSGRTSG